MDNDNTKAGMDDDVPLIHTTIGNVPVASLTHEVSWRMNDSVIHFSERYRTADGTVVREDAHVYAFGADVISDASQPQLEGANG